MKQLTLGEKVKSKMYVSHEYLFFWLFFACLFVSNPVFSRSNQRKENSLATQNKEFSMQQYLHQSTPKQTHSFVHCFLLRNVRLFSASVLPSLPIWRRYELTTSSTFIRVIMGWQKISLENFTFFPTLFLCNKILDSRKQSKASIFFNGFLTS